MTTIAAPTGTVTVGVDTHMDIHVAAALDGLGRLLGSAGFATSPAGNAELIRWAERHGPVGRVGVEGTGSYGAQLTATCSRPDTKSSRSTARTAKLAGPAARTTSSSASTNT